MSLDVVGGRAVVHAARVGDDQGGELVALAVVEAVAV
jgi:hypothetical protein